MDLGEAEVQHAGGNILALGEQHVRRLHIAVDDPARVRVCERLEHLCRSLDRGSVVELPAAKGLAERPSGHVLVSDVDVPGIASKAVGALARGMAKPCRRFRLPFRARRGLPLARDDLQRDVQAVLLVPSEPHRPGSAAPERSQRPVPTEDELALGKGWGGVRHWLSRVGGGPGNSFTHRLRRGYGLE